jgi:hypothetical protein
MTALSRVLRFEFSGALIEHVVAFSNLHRYDDRKTYKEAWTAWLAHDDIAALIKTEIVRLGALGYKGDVADKLFKSGRYYFRGKNAQKDKATNEHKAAKADRHKYVLLNRQLLDAMDNHIEHGLRQNAHAYTPANAYTPAIGFAEFCKSWMTVDSYSREVARLSEIMPTGEAVHEKLKKTYKNRYFMMTKIKPKTTKTN